MISLREDRAVIFDLYETLISEYGLEQKPKPSIARRLGLNEDEFKREWSQIQEQRFTGQIANFPSALRQICETLGYEVDNKILNQLHHERLEIKRYPFMNIDEHVLEMLTTLVESGVKVGVLSNATAEEVTAWPDSKLAELIEEAVFSCEVGKMKPDVSVYHLACNRLGVVPEATIFVGDGGFDELVGAANAGLTALWATWFLDNGPLSSQDKKMRERASIFPRLYIPFELLQRLAVIDNPLEIEKITPL
ncbi:MAG: HAD-IA family hydrolase [Caldilineaceae bacterium]